MMSHDPFVQAWLAQAGKPPQAAPGIGMGVGQGVGMKVGQGMIGAGQQMPQMGAPAPNPADPTAPVAVTPQVGTPSGGGDMDKIMSVLKMFGLGA